MNPSADAEHIAESIRELGRAVQSVATELRILSHPEHARSAHRIMSTMRISTEDDSADKNVDPS